MNNFQLTKAATVADAVRAGAEGHTSQQGARVRFIAGGTTLLDLMKLDVENPHLVVDINRLPLASIESLPDGGIKIGALTHNSDVAQYAAVKRDYTVLSQALLCITQPE